MRPAVGLFGLALVLAPAALAQTLPDLPTTQPDGSGRPTDTESEAPAETGTSRTQGPSTTGNTRTTDTARTTNQPESETESETPSETGSERPASTLSNFSVTNAPTAGTSTTSTSSGSSTSEGSVIGLLTGVPTIAGVGTPQVQIPDTAPAAFMQKSTLPDGTVFICVGAVLAFLGAAVLAWRGLVAWSLHRSVKRAAAAQNLADLKAMSAVPGKKRGMYNVVGASSNLSLDHLSAAPTGTSKPPKPFASNPAGTPPKAASSLFFSPTAGGSTGLRDANRSSSYLPAGYYAPGNAQAASGSPMTHVGGQAPHLSTNSLASPGNRYSTRSGISPPGSPSLPPSRGYDRAPPSRDGISIYNRNSVATLGTPVHRGSVYSQEHFNPSQLSLNVPGGNTAQGGRAPSAYLEDLFENHGNDPNQRY